MLTQGQPWTPDMGYVTKIWTPNGGIETLPITSFGVNYQRALMAVKEQLTHGICSWAEKADPEVIGKIPF